MAKAPKAEQMLPASSRSCGSPFPYTEPPLPGKPAAITNARISELSSGQTWCCLSGNQRQWLTSWDSAHKKVTSLWRKGHSKSSAIFNLNMDGQNVLEEQLSTNSLAGY